VALSLRIILKTVFNIQLNHQHSSNLNKCCSMA